MLEQIVSVLRSEFDVVATAKDGAAAQECIDRYHPDVAVLDIVMPHINGIDLTKQLARNGNSIKVIVCSVRLIKRRLMQHSRPEHLVMSTNLA